MPGKADWAGDWDDYDENGNFVEPKPQLPPQNQSTGIGSRGPLGQNKERNDKIVELFKAGTKRRLIARKLHISYGTVVGVLYREGFCEQKQ